MKFSINIIEGHPNFCIPKRVPRMRILRNLEPGKTIVLTYEKDVSPSEIAKERGRFYEASRWLFGAGIVKSRILDNQLFFWLPSNVTEVPQRYTVEDDQYVIQDDQSPDIEKFFKVNVFE